MIDWFGNYIRVLQLTEGRIVTSVRMIDRAHSFPRGAEF